MRVFDSFVAFAAFSLICCEETTSRGVSLKNALGSIANATSHLVLQVMDKDSGPKSKTVADHLEKIKWGMVGYVVNLMNSFRRLYEARPRVEMGPGTLKSAILAYPANYFSSRLKALLNIKKEREESEKNKINGL